jgi:DNA processing protein
VEREELTSFLALHLASGIGAKRLVALYDYFGSAERALYARPDQWQKVEGVGEGVAAALANSRDAALDASRKQIAKLPEGARIVTYYDAEYPALLKNIESPPALLFIRGNPELLTEKRMIAIVGSRKTTDYGRRASREFAETFARENVLVVSGFAKGIDTHAHEGAFEANGKTIAVLGSGVDVIYPSPNKQFAKTLIDSGRGAIVSELPLGAGPDARNFPWRNRIVAGMSKATVVVESEPDGGSMITARIAHSEKRDVFAVPGDIYRPSSGGPNLLIKDGQARPSLSAEQILVELGWSKVEGGILATRDAIDRSALSMFEAKIVDVLEAAGGPLVIDQIAERAGVEVHELFSDLFNLEMKNIVRPMAGKQYTLS